MTDYFIGMISIADVIFLPQVINAYMNLIKNRSEEDGKVYPKVHCFNTFFYPQLLNRGYSSVRRWTKKVGIDSNSPCFRKVYALTLISDYWLTLLDRSI